MKFFIGNFVQGGLAGVSTIIFLHPFYFVPIRVTADVGVGKTREFTGAIDCVKKISKSDGVKGFYRGI